MAPYSTGDSPIDLSDLKREATALLADFERAEGAIETEALERSAPGAPQSTTGADDAPVMTNAMFDADSSAPDDDAPADPTPAPSAAGDPVGAQVDELIAEAIGAVETLDVQLDATTPNGEQAAAVEGAADTIDELVIETTRTAAGAPADAPDAEPAAGTNPVSQDESAGVAQDAGATDDPTETLASVDAQIESEAQSLSTELEDFDGEFESPEDIADEAIGATAAQPEQPVAPPEPAPAIVDSPFATASAPAPPTGPETAGAPVSPAATPAAEPPAAEDTSVGADHRLAALGRYTDRFVTPERIDVIRRRVLEPLGRPLRRLDPALRDTIGWVGVNTLFIALCLWLFLLLH